MPKRAAIDLDKVLATPLGELKASDLLSALNRLDEPVAVKGLIADKKKYELWVDEGGLPDIELGEVIDLVKGEKKKLELEPPPWLDSVYPDPVMIDAIATRVEERLKNR
jgi:hypothetical protein